MTGVDRRTEPSEPLPGPLVVARNTFQETLVGFEFTEQHDPRQVDLFARACVEEFANWDATTFGYRFAQVFEPSVLKEVAMLEGVSYDDLVTLAHKPTRTMRHLASLVEDAPDATVVELVGIAAALISVSRFDLAARILGLADAKASDARERFEIAMLEFAVSNRRDDGGNSPPAFKRMRDAIESTPLPPDRVLDACSQAVVWYLKRREVHEDDVAWYVQTGSRLVASRSLDPGSISAWYRAVAMLPAARGEKEQTRRYMEFAREAGAEAYALRPSAYDQHFLKTYFESAIKEHIYVTRDFEEARRAGDALIELDPAWAPSYGEVAEIYERFDEPTEAARWYETAAEKGAPYVGNHLAAAIRCHERAGDEEAAAECRRVLSAVPSSSSLATERAAGSPVAEAPRYLNRQQ